jgi:hypothetical protein
MIRKPVVDPDRTNRVWEGDVLAVSGAYEMAP